jgi:ankyrin repeat protein
MYPAVRILLDHHCDPNVVREVDDERVTPLVIACELRTASIAEALLRARADPNPLTFFSPLDVAVFDHSNHYMIYTLLKFRADVHGGKSTPLCNAAADNNVRLMELLVMYNADINRPNISGWSPLHCGAAMCAVGAVQHLLKLSADINVCDDDSQTPLQVIGDGLDHVTNMHIGQMQRIQSLLEK